MHEGSDALFNLAVNRALVYVRRNLPPGVEWTEEEVLARLELWALRTRFASRFDLSTIVSCVRDAPSGDVNWQGGPSGSWVKGRMSRP